MWIMFVIGLVLMIPSFVPFVQRGLTQSTNNLVPNEIPAIAQLITLRVRGIISEMMYHDLMKLQGIEPNMAILLQHAEENLLNALDYVTLFRRGKITRGVLDNYMERLGYSDAEKEHIVDVTEYFPGVGDLIRFAVREAYSPDVVATFRTDEDLPPVFFQEAAKAGVGRDQATNFWRAHWTLPSSEQGFDLYQRGIITLDQLQLLLKTLDVMPFWRDKLVQLAYSPLTRVDVRRMYGEGVLKAEQLPRQYQNVGYSPENANLLSAFTVKYESKETDGITRAQVMKAYVDDLLSREEFEGYLKLFGYSEEVTAFWLDQGDYEKVSEELDLYSSDLVAQYMAGGKDISQVKMELDALDLPSAHVQKVLRKIVLSKGQKLKVPAKEDLDEWLRLGTIDEVEYARQLRMLGYEEWAIELYLTQAVESGNIKARKYLPLTTYVKWFTQKIITEARLRELMTEQNYSTADIDLTVAEATE